MKTMKNFRIILMACIIQLLLVSAAYANDFVKISESKSMGLYIDEDRIYVEPDKQWGSININTCLQLKLTDAGRERYSKFFGDKEFLNADYMIVNILFEYGQGVVTQQLLNVYDYNGNIIYSNAEYVTVDFKKGTDFFWWSNMVKEHVNYMFSHGAKYDANSTRVHY